MKNKTKTTLITENKGNARIWIQGDADVENHGFTDGQVFTVSYGLNKVVLQLTGLKRNQGLRVDKEYKRKHNLPQSTMKVSKTARGSTIDIGNRQVSLIADSYDSIGQFIPYQLKHNKDSNHNSMEFLFNKTANA